MITKRIVDKDGDEDGDEDGCDENGDGDGCDEVIGCWRRACVLISVPHMLFLGILISDFYCVDNQFRTYI